MNSFGSFHFLVFLSVYKDSYFVWIDKGRERHKATMDKGGQRKGGLYSAKQGGQHEARTGNDGQRTAAPHVAKGGNMKPGRAT
jgi:hypothetical protein